MVEGGEIFGGASATGDDDYVHVAGLVEIAEAGGDFLSGTLFMIKP